MDFDDDEHVLEVGANVFGSEREGPRLLENDGDDVIPYVPLPQQLVQRDRGRIDKRKRKKRGRRGVEEAKKIRRKRSK